MKFLLFPCLLLLAACATSVPNDIPLAEQSKDLRDDDDDGVINARDKCANTPHSAIVDNDGCPTYVANPEEGRIHILFANDSTQITTEYQNQISEMSQFLKTHPSTYIELKGYASPVGSSDYNVGLSQRRAQVVKQSLLDSGITKNRIMTVGFGDTEPVSAESQEVTNTLSRRVTAQVKTASNKVVEEWTIFTLRQN
ncbi:OmpA family protein [Photobacterium sanguinicancri]|uniref:OmpA family protein n=1 Tax=Photobacterium sanguinicancri TaxID=875932 RepID=A0AAW7Y2H5_9GAMM|nr:OmpA family protein [Photobacterium sanguinicancri]MDO6542225.1 OmpA family protein [Photobacterium sanguinicancri]